MAAAMGYTNRTITLMTPNKSKFAGRKVPISPMVERLFPAFTMMPYVSSIEANFGDDPAKPFEYDIQNCPGLELTCI
jgi:hypothetical protein